MPAVPPSGPEIRPTNPRPVLPSVGGRVLCWGPGAPLAGRRSADLQSAPEHRQGIGSDRGQGCRGGLQVRAPSPCPGGHQVPNTKPALPRREDGPGVSWPGFRAGGQDQGTRATMGSHQGPAPLAPTARMRMLTKLPEGRSLKVWLARGLTPAVLLSWRAGRLASVTGRDCTS